MFDFHEVAAPYPGLRPFEPFEGEIFFGREGHTDRLLEILQAQGFLSVIGPSGGGKSSLVRAGLLPALAAGRLGTGSHWRLALLRPGHQPLLALAQALIAPHALGPELLADGAAAPSATTTSLLPATVADATVDGALIAAELRRGPESLARLLAQAQARRVAQAGGKALPPLNLLILADQFEEVFTYRNAAPDPKEGAAFVDLLLAARELGQQAAADGIRPVVALTMRTDFLGDCVQFAELPEAINRSQYLTPRLKREELRAAILGPARLFDGEVDEGFIEQVIDQIGANSDQLPQLQHALARWWQAAAKDSAQPLIGADQAAKMGDVANALNQHAEQLYASFSPAGQQACEWLFRAICTGREGTAAVRRPQTLSAIATWSSQPLAELQAVVQQLAAPDVSFLHHGRQLDEKSVIDLTHEALMRQWGSLQGWIDSELERGLHYDRWQARAKDHAQCQGELLSGADLARALEWWHPGAAGEQGWQPTPAWLDRYAELPKPLNEDEQKKNKAQLATLWQELRQFLLDSHTAERDAREVEQRRLEAEAVAAQEQAERERQRAAHEQELAVAAQASARKAKRWSYFAFFAAVLMLLAIVFIVYQKNSRIKELFETQLAHASMLAQAQDYEAARKVLQESTQLGALPPESLHARNLLASHINTMAGPEVDKVYRADGDSLPALTGGVVISPNGQLLAAAGERGILVLYDAANGSMVKQLKVPFSNPQSAIRIQAIVFEPNGHSLYSVDENCKVIHWSIPSGDILGGWHAGCHSARGLVPCNIIYFVV